jgi:phage baseplate assembly protein W
MTNTMLGEVQAEVANAILKNEPQVELTEVQVTRKSIDDTILIVRVVWRAVTRGTQRNAVLTDERTTEVEI